MSELETTPDDYYDHFLFMRQIHDMDGACGPGSLHRFFPQGPFQLACQYHDFAYGLGGSKKQFYAVERQFKRLLLASAGRSLKWKLFAITYSAWTITWGWHLRRWRREVVED